LFYIIYFVLYCYAFAVGSVSVFISVSSVVLQFVCCRYGEWRYYKTDDHGLYCQ